MKILRFGLTIQTQIIFNFQLTEVSHLFYCIVIVVKKPEGLDFHNREVIDLRNTATNKHCLKRKFDVVKGRTYDDKNPALQADVEGGTSSASCASLACGYENMTFQVSYYVPKSDKLTF